MTNIQVAQAFANGETKGQSGTMFIEGFGNDRNGRYAAIYSYGYHFPIAIKELGSNQAIFNTDGYSNTTARHKGHVRRALEGMGFDLLQSNTQRLKSQIDHVALGR